MKNIKLTISYLGTDYCGWQIQNTRARQTKKHRPSIQGIIEETLSKIFQEKIKIVGSGRTDAGVHARAQVANFHTNSQISPANIQQALNGLLPDDIVITRIEEADEEFHARYSARWKSYRYTMVNQKFPDVFYHQTTYHVPYSLNIPAMCRAAKYLTGGHDFRAFQGRGSRNKAAVRTLKHVQIRSYTDRKKLRCDKKDIGAYGLPCPVRARLNSVGASVYRGPDGNLSRRGNILKDCPYGTVPSLICIDLKADGFLHNMARRIVGLLLEVGRGKIGPGRVKDILDSKGRSLVGPTVPAKGLCLMQVEY